MKFDPMRTMREHDPKMVHDLKDLLTFVPEGSIGVEIGCFLGESTEIMLRSGKFRLLHCIDPWAPGYYADRDMAEIERAFDRRIADLGNDWCVTKMKMRSDEGLRSLAEKGEAPNFIYIDGDHRYNAVKQDLLLALQLLNGRGIIAGHDYGRKRSPGVKEAVKEILGFPDVRFAGWSWLKHVERIQKAACGECGEACTHGDTICQPCAEAYR